MILHDTRAAGAGMIRMIPSRAGAFVNQVLRANDANLYYTYFANDIYYILK
jgi:hypothetical protein